MRSERTAHPGEKEREEADGFKSERKREEAAEKRM